MIPANISTVYYYIAGILVKELSPALHPALLLKFTEISDIQRQLRREYFSSLGSLITYLKLLTLHHSLVSIVVYSYASSYIYALLYVLKSATKVKTQQYLHGGQNLSELYHPDKRC